ncbi:P-type ATPase, partial [Aspergillus sclerotialis]
MVTRKAWIPGVGIYSVENSSNASDPTEGIVTLGKAPRSRQEVEAERLAREEAFDRKRSTAGISFDLPSEKVHKDVEKAVETPESAVSSNPEVTPELQAFLESAALCNLAS